MPSLKDMREKAKEAGLMKLDKLIETRQRIPNCEIPIPIKVRLSGKASPYAKGQLQQIITEELGIEKENQIWT